jgi:hypothetical protein
MDVQSLAGFITPELITAMVIGFSLIIIIPFIHYKLNLKPKIDAANAEKINGNRLIKWFKPRQQNKK